MQKSTYRNGTLLLLLTALLACSTLPDRGHDKVAVMIGDAAVFRRERFLGDRYEDLQWLRAQLAEDKLAEYEQGFQGASNVQYRKQLGFAARAAFDAELGVTLQSSDAGGGGGEAAPEAGDGNTDGGEAGGGDGTAAATATVTPPAETEEPSPGPTPVSLGDFNSDIQFTDAELGAAILERIGPAPQVSPQDKLRNRLAFRDEVRGAIRQRALDDTHDLMGSALYDLQFDLSLAAGENPGSAYIVALTLQDEHATARKPQACRFCADEPQECGECSSDRAEQDAREALAEDRLGRAVQAAVAREIINEAYNFGQRISENSLSTRSSELAANAIRRGQLVALVAAMDDLLQAARELEESTSYSSTHASANAETLDKISELAKKDPRLANIAVRAHTLLQGALGQAKSDHEQETKRISVLDEIQIAIDRQVEATNRQQTAPRVELNDGHLDVDSFLAMLLEDDVNLHIATYNVDEIRKQLGEIVSSRLTELDRLEERHQAATKASQTASDFLARMSELDEVANVPDDLLEQHSLTYDAGKGAAQYFGTRNLFDNDLPSAQQLEELLGYQRHALYFGPPASPLRAAPEARPKAAPKKPTAGRSAASPASERLERLQERVVHLPWDDIRPYARRCGEIVLAHRAVEDYASPFVSIDPPRGLGAESDVADLDFIKLEEAPSGPALRALMSDLGSAVRVVGISPEEQAEQISTTAQADLRHAFELAASGQVSATTALGANFSNLSEELRRYDMIARNPLLVGFIHAAGFREGQTRHTDSRPTFGWIISPRLMTSTKGKADLRYQQLARHHAVRATMIAPAHLRRLHFKVDVFEIRKNGSLRVHRPDVLGTGHKLLADGTLMVEMPPDVDAIVRGIQYAVDPHTAEPSLIGGNWAVRAGEKARIVIQGQNIWRGPEVYLGGQKASKVNILPDLEGLAVEFDAIEAPPTLDKEPIKADLMVSTSQGTDVLQGSVQIYPPKSKKKTSSTPKAKLASNAVLARQGAKTTDPVVCDLAFDLDPPLPKGTSQLRLRVRRDQALGTVTDAEVPADRIRLDAARKKLTVTDVALQLSPSNDDGERFAVDLFYTPGVGEEEARLTAAPLSLVVLRTTVDADLPGGTQVTYTYDEGDKLLRIGSEARLTTSGGIDLELLRTYERALVSSSGAPAKVRLGGVEIGTFPLRLTGAAGSRALSLTLPASTSLRGLPLTNKAPTDNSPKLEWVLGDLTIEVKKIDLVSN